MTLNGLVIWSEGLGQLWPSRSSSPPAAASLSYSAPILRALEYLSKVFRSTSEISPIFIELAQDQL